MAFSVKLSTNINTKDIFIMACDLKNSNDIQIKVHVINGFDAEHLSMTVPKSSESRITQDYLQMVGEKLIEAQRWDF